MNPNYLEFEQPIAELQAKIEELRLVGSDSEINISEEIARLEAKSQDLTRSVFKNLSAWQVAQLARHPLRPHTKDYIGSVFTDFDELHGDRSFKDDKAIVAGLARLGDDTVMLIGQQKGRDTKQKIERNFGMVHPEGYRRALRLMKMAEHYQIPVITFIDTPGAYPGVGAEARGQSEAIARNLLEMSALKVPVICVVIGEGCSGGALGIGVGDTIMMCQYAYYATISPEGCASILWRSAEKAPEAAEVMGITAGRLKELGLIDKIIDEPLGGAHRNPQQMAVLLQEELIAQLATLKEIPLNALLQRRYDRLMRVTNTD
jgi:acetyl-CoA carboxylase carboxyl transferase subunit alpha